MSYAFDGANDKLTGSFASTYQVPMTIACWIKVTAHPLANDVFLEVGKNSAATTDSMYLRTESADNTWSFRAEDSAGNTNIASVSLDIDGVWTPFVGRYTSTTLRDIYVDSYSTTGTSTNSRTVVDIAHIIVGENFAGGADFTGNIAEIAVWDKALSQAEIEAFMAGDLPSTIAASDLIGYWPLNANNATQTNEGVDTGGDLTVTGATYAADHPTMNSATLPAFQYQTRHNTLLRM